MIVVLNHDTNCVLWGGNGYGKEVLSRVFERLTVDTEAKTFHPFCLSGWSQMDHFLH